MEHKLYVPEMPGPATHTKCPGTWELAASQSIVHSCGNRRRGVELPAAQPGGLGSRWQNASSAPVLRGFRNYPLTSSGKGTRRKPSGRLSPQLSGRRSISLPLEGNELRVLTRRRINNRRRTGRERVCWVSPSGRCAEQFTKPFPGSS